MASHKAVFLIFLISMLGKQAYNIIWGFRPGRGGSRISGKGVHMFKGLLRFANFISFFLNIP